MALGESIVATGIGIAQLPVTLPIVAAVLIGLAISAALWWAYFDVTAPVAERALAAAEGSREIRLARNGYSYLHLPMALGALLIGMLGVETIRHAEQCARIRHQAHDS